MVHTPAAAATSPSKSTSSCTATASSQPYAPELSLPTRRRLIRKPLPGVPTGQRAQAAAGTAATMATPNPGAGAARQRIKHALHTSKADDDHALGWWPTELPIAADNAAQDLDGGKLDGDGDDTDKALAQRLLLECGLDDQSAAHLRTLLTYSLAYHPPELQGPQYATARSQLAPGLYLSLLAALEHLSHPALIASLQRTAAMRWRAEQQLRAEAAAAASAAAAAASASSGSGAGSSALLSRWARLGWSAAGARKGAASNLRSASAPIPAPYIPSSLLGYNSALHHGPLGRIEAGTVSSITSSHGGLFAIESSADHEQRLRKRDVALKILSNAAWFARTYSTPGAFGLPTAPTSDTGGNVSTPRHSSAQVSSFADKATSQSETLGSGGTGTAGTDTAQTSSLSFLRGVSQPLSATTSAPSSRPGSKSGRPSFSGAGLGSYIAKPTPTTALSVGHGSSSGLEGDGTSSDTASETSSRRGSIIEHDLDDSDTEEITDEDKPTTPGMLDPKTPSRKGNRTRTASLSERTASGTTSALATPRQGSASAFADDRLGAGVTSKSTAATSTPSAIRSRAFEQLSSLNAAAGASSSSEIRSRSLARSSSSQQAQRLHRTPSRSSMLSHSSRTSASSSSHTTATTRLARSSHSEAEAAETALLEQAEREHQARVRRECEEWAKMVRCRICVRTVLPEEEAAEAIRTASEQEAEQREEKERTVTARRVASSSSSSGATDVPTGERSRTASESQQSVSSAQSIASTETGSGASVRSDKTEKGAAPAPTHAGNRGGMLDLRSLFAGYLGTDESATSLPGHSVLSASIGKATGAKIAPQGAAFNFVLGEDGSLSKSGSSPSQRIKSPVIWKPDVFQGTDLFHSFSATSQPNDGSAAGTGTNEEEAAQRERVVGGTFFVRCQSEAEAVWVRSLLEVLLFAGCAMLLEAALLRDSGVRPGARTRRGQMQAVAQLQGSLGVGLGGADGNALTLKGVKIVNGGRGSLGRSSSLGGGGRSSGYGGVRRRSLSRRISDAAAAATAVAATATGSAVPAYLKREASDGSSTASTSGRFRTSSVPSPYQGAEEDTHGGTSPSTPKATSCAATAAPGSARGKRWSTKSLWSMIQTQAHAAATGVGAAGGADSASHDGSQPSRSSTDDAGENDDHYRNGSAGGMHGAADAVGGWIQRHNPLALASSSTSVRSGLSRSGSERRAAGASRDSADEGRVSGGTPQSMRSSVDVVRGGSGSGSGHAPGSPLLAKRRGSGEPSGLRRALTREEGSTSSSSASPHKGTAGSSGGQALKNSIGFPRSLSLKDSEGNSSPKGSSRSAGSTTTANSLGQSHRLSNFGRILKPFLLGSKGRADHNRIDEGVSTSDSADGAGLTTATSAPVAKELPPWPDVNAEDLRWPPPLTTSPEIARMIQSLSERVGDENGSTGRPSSQVQRGARGEGFLAPFSQRQNITVLVEGKSDVITFVGSDICVPARAADRAEVAGAAGGNADKGSQAGGGGSTLSAASAAREAKSSNTPSTISSASGQSIASSAATHSTNVTADTQATSATAATGVSGKTAASNATSANLATNASSATMAATPNPYFHHASTGTQRHREEVAFYARTGRSRDLPLGQLVEEMGIRAIHAEAQLDELRTISNEVGGSGGGGAAGASAGTRGGAFGVAHATSSSNTSSTAGAGAEKSAPTNKQSSKETAKAAAEAANAIMAGQVIHYFHGHHRVTVSSRLISDAMLAREQERLRARRSGKGGAGMGADAQEEGVAGGTGKVDSVQDEADEGDGTSSGGAYKDPTLKYDMSSANESDVVAVAAALHTDPESARRAVIEADSALRLAESTDLLEPAGEGGKTKHVSSDAGTSRTSASDAPEAGGLLTRAVRPLGKAVGFGVWMWEANVRTGRQTTPRLMSEATYLLSFAKYLEALIYHPALRDVQVGDESDDHRAANGDDEGDEDGDTTINIGALQRIKDRLRSVVTTTSTTPTKPSRRTAYPAYDPSLETARFDIARFFRVGRALVKICVRPVTIFQLLIEGPVISLHSDQARFLSRRTKTKTRTGTGAGRAITGGEAPRSSAETDVHGAGRSSFESARRIDVGAPGTDDAASERAQLRFDDLDLEETRLEIQRFFAGVKEIVTRLEGILVERELDVNGVTIKAKPGDETNSKSSQNMLSLLTRVRSGLREDEFELYDLLKDTPVESINDVRKALQDRAKSTKNRLQAWVKKHLSAAEIAKLGPLKYDEPWYAVSSIHTFPGSRFVIREDEPLSIISFSLSSRDYRNEIRAAGAGPANGSQPVDKTSDVLQWRSGVADGSTQGSSFSNSASSSYSNRPESGRPSKGGAGGTGGGPNGLHGLDPDRDHVYYEPEPVSVRMKRKRRGRDTSILSLTLRRVGSSVSASSGSGVPTPSNENGPQGSSAGGSGFVSTSFGAGGADSSMDSSEGEEGDGVLGLGLGVGLGVSALDPTMLDLSSTPVRRPSRSQAASSTPTASIISSVGPGQSGLTPSTTSGAGTGTGTGTTTTFKAHVTQVSGQPGSLASIFTKDSATTAGTSVADGVGDSSVESASSTASISGQTEDDRSERASVRGQDGSAAAAAAAAAPPPPTGPSPSAPSNSIPSALQTPTSLAASGLNALWAMSSPFQSFKGGRQHPTALVAGTTPTTTTTTASPRVFSEAGSTRSSGVAAAGAAAAAADVSVAGSAQSHGGGGGGGGGGGAANLAPPTPTPGPGPTPTPSIPRAPAETPHVKHSVYHGTTKVSCVAWFAEEFAALRSKWGVGDDYLASLSRCRTWNAAGGKSKSQFFKTADDRFVAKQLLNVWNLDEMEAFLAFAPAYLRYAHNAVVNDCPSLLVKILGCYSLKIKHGDGVKVKMTIQVVENLFAGGEGGEGEVGRLVRYDLKGIRERKVKASASASAAAAAAEREGAGDKGGGGAPPMVWWDAEWIENCRPRAFVPESQRDLFVLALKNDLAFLTESNVMDYSLLVGMYEPEASSAELSARAAGCGLGLGGEEEEEEDDEDEEAALAEEEEDGDGLAVGEEDNELGPKVATTGTTKARTTSTSTTGRRRRRVRQPMIRARIVDYIGTFTLAKQLESSSKKALKSGLEAKSNVTILPPGEYAERFGTAMLAAFTGCPDRTTLADVGTTSSAAVRGGLGAKVALPSVL